MKVIPTRFPHERDAYGRRLSSPCPGMMELRLPPSGPVECACSVCGRGWMFEFRLDDQQLSAGEQR